MVRKERRCSGPVSLEVVGKNPVVVALHWRRKLTGYQSWRRLRLSSLGAPLILLAALARPIRLLDLCRSLRGGS
jgi:hypothetical protein